MPAVDLTSRLVHRTHLPPLDEMRRSSEWRRCSLVESAPSEASGRRPRGSVAQL